MLGSVTGVQRPPRWSVASLAVGVTRTKRNTHVGPVLGEVVQAFTAGRQITHIAGRGESPKIRRRWALWVKLVMVKPMQTG